MRREAQAYPSNADNVDDMINMMHLLVREDCTGACTRVQTVSVL